MGAQSLCAWIAVADWVVHVTKSWGKYFQARLHNTGSTKVNTALCGKGVTTEDWLNLVRPVLDLHTAIDSRQIVLLP